MVGLTIPAGDAVAVKCDACGGRRYIGGVLCERCQGNGRVVITVNRTVSRDGALLNAAIFFLVLAVAIVAILAL